MGHIILLGVIGLVLLVMASAFFAGSETAMTGISRARMYALENKGNARARMVNRLREKKGKMIGALLLGNTLVNVLVGSLATSVTINLFGEKYVILVTFVVAALLLVFSEVMPKTYAITHADRMALFLAPSIAVVVAVFAPVTHAVEKLVGWFFHLLGVGTGATTAQAQEEELRGAIALLREKDEEDPEDGQEKRAMLRSILDLADVSVEKVMIHRKNVRMIDRDLPVQKIVDDVLHNSFTRLPVWKDDPDNIVGVIHTKLLLQEMRRCNGDATKVRLENAIMAPWFIPESTTLFDQLQLFRRRGERFAIMVDEYGVLVGVITLEDILEEIVGKMRGEYDAAGVSGVRPQPDGTFIVDGKVTIRDINRELHWKMPDEEYSTVAGLLLFETQRIPSVGQSFVFHGYRFEVLKKQRNQIMLVKIMPPASVPAIAASGASATGG